MRFHKRKKYTDDKVELRFQDGINAVKDLDKKEFKRYIEGLTLAWQGYDRIRKVQTIDEKESAPIDETEAYLTKEFEKKGEK